MTSKDIELIKKMLQMQAKLDKAIMKEYGLEEIEEEKLNMAILDEIDEDYPEDRCMKEYAPRYCPNCGRKIVD